MNGDALKLLWLYICLYKMASLNRIAGLHSAWETVNHLSDNEMYMASQKLRYRTGAIVLLSNWPAIMTNCSVYDKKHVNIFVT